MLINKVFGNVLVSHTVRKVLAKCYTEGLKSHQKDLMSRGLPHKKPIIGVKQIVLISSGKGGVGKSTTAVNLSTALKLVYPNKNVGLLDADIFGPSIPLMMNLHDTPFLTEKNLMVPLVNYGVKCMSMGFLIEGATPVLWRGLMVMQALEKLIRQVDWGDIDWLIVDTPPGTGDTHLSLVQNLPISGVVLVTTPQTAALQVAKRGAGMYDKLNIPIIGIVENMSHITCPTCSSDIKVFGNGTKQFSKAINTEILESFPLNKVVSEGVGNGLPIVLNGNSLESNLYRNLAKKVVNFLKNKAAIE
ncbi:iron-sulfur protein NUBPL [Cylas formicarius]|uniref:iron-sulfur protein NUBPL n=1 Tax=Cylas formicarius TaxID=197179 RepID=UPI002958423E|nr:iron-sulfur protein NUBPL [Cylas formicarius]